MRVIYRTKYPLKHVLFSIIIVLAILFYIFLGLLHFTIIIAIGVISIYLISITMIPIFNLDEDAFSRIYFFKPFRAEYVYKLNNILKIEVRQNRQGYQAFSTMKIFFKENGVKKNHLFYYIKDSQKDFDNLIEKAQKERVAIKLLYGN